MTEPFQVPAVIVPVEISVPIVVARVRAAMPRKTIKTQEITVMAC
jgi:hypothetical protein